MSLQSLTKLRIEKNQAPASVWVLVGDVPDWIEDAPDLVLIKAGTKSFDLRPLIGLHVDIFEIGNHCRLLFRVLDALDDVHLKSRGLACLSGISGLNPDHERILKNAKEILCN